MEHHVAPNQDVSGLPLAKACAAISLDVLESFLVCKTKAHLRLTRQSGKSSDYGSLTEDTRERLRRKLDTVLSTRHRDYEVFRGGTVSESRLRQLPALVLHCVVENEDVSFRCDALKRVAGACRLGDDHYVPVLVYEGFTIRPQHRAALETCALLLGEVQGRVPDHGFLFQEGDPAPRRIPIRADLAEARPRLHEIRQLRDESGPPILTLNDHCQICEYRERCHAKAIAEDNITLLRGMSERTAQKFRKRGITTVAQISRTFRAQKKNKRSLKNRRPHSYALQAQALCDNRIYVNGTPSLVTAAEMIFFDLEGDPERDFVYLIGAILVDGGVEKRFSFWADDKSQESSILDAFLTLIQAYPSRSLLHYGSYETAFLKRMRRGGTYGQRIERVLERSVNVLDSVYGTIYFPCHSNSLKDIATYAGFSWTDPNASGVQSLVWRRRWEQGGGDTLKRQLIEYNLEDCAALKRVTEVIRALVAAFGIPGVDGALEKSPLDLPWSRATDAHARYQKWSAVRFVCPDFEFINKCSYFDYQQQKVHLGPRRAPRGATRPTTTPTPTPRIARRVRMTARKCPRCDGTSVTASPGPGWRKLVYDLKITSGGMRRNVIEVRAPNHRCGECDKEFLPRKFKRLDTLSHATKSWSMYMHVAHQLSTPKLCTMFRDLFGLKVDAPRFFRMKLMMAHYYAPAVRQILRNIIAGGVVYVDETEVKLKKTKGYVWVLSNTKEVLYLYRPSREIDFLHDYLAGFTGVLVTDFYAAYDALGCRQQKCLVHLMRDLNGGLVENPFDDDLKRLAFEFGKLLRVIVTTIDRHGLKRNQLLVHRRDVDRFYREVVEPAARSEAAERFRARFLKQRQALFEFLNHDGVAWNNNYAEHAIKVFAKYRVISDGNMSEEGISAYLALMSIHQTCATQRISLLKYFLSGEKDLDSYRRAGRHPAKPFRLAEYPSRFYIPWPTTDRPINR